MHISNYQIHNVLNVYSKQLSQNGITNKFMSEFQKILTDQVDLFSKEKRKATIKKVSDQILNKISELGNEVATDSYDSNISKDQSAPAVEPEKSKDNEFVFNVIDKINQKKTTTYSVKDISLLMNNIEQLAKEFLEKEGE
jgi:ABC-type sulfate transport system substrate-binding protein